MAFDQLLAVCGICVSLLSTPYPTLCFLSILALNVYTWQLKYTLSMKISAQEISTREQIAALKQTKSELSEMVKEVFELASDFFCVYQEEEVLCASKSFSNSLPNVKTFWRDHLREESKKDFAGGVQRALSGESVYLSVKLQRPDTKPPQTIISLSPILDALIESCHEESLRLSMRKVRWEGKPAVLIHTTLPRREAPVHNFIKTFNHEFRTPLNIIIGLSDLILGDKEMTIHSLEQRQKLLRQCACTLLATINSIIHQCELEWKLPTGLQHVVFNPKVEIKQAVQLVQKKLQRRGNTFDFILDNSIPNELWGNAGQFRHVIAFLIQTCSESTQNDRIFMSLKSSNSPEKCELTGELSASCPAICTSSEFNSVLQLFCAPFESEPSADSPLTSNFLQQTDRQSMLRLSVAREMCRLFLGDMFVNDIGNLSLRFTMVLSNRENFVLKRKGNIFADEVEFVPVKSPSYAKIHVSEEMFEDLTPLDFGVPTSKMRSQTTIAQVPLAFLDKRRRIKTVPGGQTDFEQPPCNKGDSGDPSPMAESKMLESFALIAEDVPSNALILSDMLKRLGVRSMIVSNGTEALSAMEKFMPDIIFMDCQMPIMDGLEATRHIRAMRIKVPIVAVTANGPEKETECLEAGMDFFMSKPVRFDRLAALLRRLNMR